MKKLLITGSNGFIGKYLCKECLENKIDFRAMSRSGQCPVFPNWGYQADLLDQAAIEKILQDYQPDTIIHLAAIASPVHNNITEIYNVNVHGTEILLNAASKYLSKGTKLILASTAGVYGNQPVPLLHEDLSYNPVNHYSYSKMVVEMLARQYTQEMEICIVRPFNIIGIGQDKNFFISKLVNRFKNKKKELFLGNLDAVRDYVSVEFCAKVLLKLAVMQAPMPPILNICSGQGYSCRDVIQILEQLTGHQPTVHSTSEFIRSNEIWRLVGDRSRLDSIMAPIYEQESLESILSRMLLD